MGALEADEINILLAGQTGVGKSSVANMIMGRQDNSVDAAKVSCDAHPCTTETKSYIARLDSGVQYRLWDTRGLDEAVEHPGIKTKIRELFVRAPDRDLKAACRDRIKKTSPILIWCIHASKIDTIFYWEQFRKVYVEYCEKKATPVIVLTKMTVSMSGEWESRCMAQLKNVGLDSASYNISLIRVREYKKAANVEYSEDAQSLKRLVSRVSSA